MSSQKRKLSLALQGGGSHGAFTWGVLDRLLEETNLEIEAVSGTSAGAFNGAVLAYGLKSGGREQARRALNGFWRSVSEAGSNVFNPNRTTPFSKLGWNTDWSPLAIWLEIIALIWSPYDNPFYSSKLDEVLARSIPDFTPLNRRDKPQLFVCATNVTTNERKIFSAGEISIKALLASACLPLTFQAVQAEDGNVYWDGGYTGNPALSPLLAQELPPDIVIVWVNPLTTETFPVRAREILDRLNELNFNSTLVQEINTIETLNKLIARGALKVPEYKQVYLHSIADEKNLRPLGFNSKSNTAWDFLAYLHSLGRNAANAWLKTDGGKIGRKTSANMARILGGLQSPMTRA
jgi:NTE family protein